MPQSAIAESLRQILSGVAKRYLTRCSFAVPLLRKTGRGDSGDSMNDTPKHTKGMEAKISGRYNRKRRQYVSGV